MADDGIATGPAVLANEVRPIDFVHQPTKRWNPTLRLLVRFGQGSQSVSQSGKTLVKARKILVEPTGRGLAAVAGRQRLVIAPVRLRERSGGCRRGSQLG